MFGLSIAAVNKENRRIWLAWVCLTAAMIAVFFVVARLAFVLQETSNLSKQQGTLLRHVVTQLDVELAELRSAVELAGAEDARSASTGLVLLRREFDSFLTKQQQTDVFIDSSSDGLAASFDELMNAEASFLETYKDVVVKPDAELLMHVASLRSDLIALIELRETLLLTASAEMLEQAETLEGQRAADFGVEIWGISLLSALIALMALSAGYLTLASRRGAEKMQINLENMNAVLDNSAEALVLMGRDIKIVAIGGAASKMFGLTSDRMVGKNAMELFASELPSEEMVRRCQQFFIDRPDWIKDGRRLELNGRRMDGSTFPVEVGFSFVKAADGTELMMASIADFSEHAERELSLMQARNEALQAERAKSRFLSSISHEMRTPLNGVLASLDLMRETTEMSGTQKELAAIIERSGDDALEQIENVLELTRLDTLANSAIAVAPFSPATITQEIVENALSKANLAHNNLRFETKVPHNVIVEGSAILFRQIIHSFLSNANKFTADGDITVRLQTKPGARDGHLIVLVSVQDSGIGIAPRDLERIFQNFETIRDSYNMFRAGSGLGLSIAKHSADLMGGEIDVTSTVGKGSTFTLRVEFQTVKQAAGEARGVELAPKQQVLGETLNVLVVEDNEINRRMLVDMVKSRGHRVDEACDGVEGVAKGREEQFDLILMDISMPKLDGVGATRMLRQFGRSQHGQIVAVTAHAQPEHTKEFMEVGIDRILTKPLRMNTLDSLFGEMLRKRSVTDEASTANVKKLEIVETGVSGPSSLGLEDKAQGEVTEILVEEKEDELADALIEGEVFEALLDLLGGESVDGYLAQFENDAEAMLPTFVAAIKSGDYATARAEAHKCAGGAAVIGAGEVHKVLQEMTHSADDQNGQNCLALAGRLPNLVIDTMASMRQRL